MLRSLCALKSTRRGLTFSTTLGPPAAAALHGGRSRTFEPRDHPRSLHCIADLCVVPLGGEGAGVGDKVASCVKLIRDSGLASKTHAYGTNIEGELADVLAVVQKCHEEMHASGVVRISSTVKIGTRTDKATSIDAKMQRVDEELAKLV